MMTMTKAEGFMLEHLARAEARAVAEVNARARALTVLEAELAMLVRRNGPKDAMVREFATLVGDAREALETAREIQAKAEAALLEAGR